MELEEELLRFLKKYNVKYWMEKDEDSGSNGEFEIVSEKEYAKRISRRRRSRRTT